jgi:Flp pilus assembly protein TadD
MTKSPAQIAKEELQIILGSHRNDLIIEKAKKLLSLDPHNIFGIHALIGAYINSQQYESAKETTKQAISQWPNEDQLYYYLYFYYLWKGDIEYLDAKVAIEKAIELAPEKDKYYRELAEIYLINWEPMKAKKLLEKAVQMSPNNAEYKSRLALALVRTANKNGGLAQAEKALREDPTDHRVLDSVGMVYIISGELDKAEQLFRNALRESPTREYYQKHLDWVMRERKDQASRVKEGKTYTPLYLRQKGSKRFFDEEKIAERSQQTPSRNN